MLRLWNSRDCETVYVDNLYKYTQPGGGGYSVRKLLGVCRGPLKIGPKKIEGKMVFWGQKDRILRVFVPKRSFLCWWMRKNTPKRSCLILPKWKKGVKTAAHMYHPSHREYPPRDTQRMETMKQSGLWSSLGTHSSLVVIWWLCISSSGETRKFNLFKSNLTLKVNSHPKQQGS